MYQNYFIKAVTCVSRAPSKFIRRSLSRRQKKIVQKKELKGGLSNSAAMARIRSRLDDSLRTELLKSSATNESDIGLESLAAQRFFESHSAEYASLTARKQEISRLKQSESTDVIKLTKESVWDFPLEAKPIISEKGHHFAQNNPSTSEMCSQVDKTENTRRFSVDRGFYVQGNIYTDDYIAGTTFEIPDDKLESETLRFGPEDAVEVIDFQRPHQESSSVKSKMHLSFNAETDLDSDWTVNYGTVDSAIAASDKSCSGCGAKFHCKDASLPGFLPVELFLKVDSGKDKDTVLCRRCYLLKEHNFLVNMNVCNVDYCSMMQHLKLKQEALILLVVDMMDLPFSFYPGLSVVIGDRKPMIVIGNKVDLLPPDYHCGYLRHYRNMLIRTAEETGFSNAFNILHFALISAKTGFGVEDLITNIHLNWASKFGSLRNDLYLVGCTNAGKSTLFNTFLQSDLCKVRALDLVERATTSIWPGTTISLLKFPVMKIAPYRLEIRRRRLLANRKWERKENKLRQAMLKDTGDLKYAVLQAHVDNSYKIREEELQPISILDIRRQEEGRDQFISEKKKKAKVWNPDDPVFAEGNWCYDTPGTVNNEQVLNLFTLDELISVVPRKIVFPRTFLVHVGETLLVGGIAQITVLDLAVEKTSSVLLTVFANDSLPINVIRSDDVQSFLHKYFGTKALVVPSGNAHRLSRFPKLIGKNFEISTIGMEVGSADIILSSIGWACLTAKVGTVKIGAFTPAGKGLALRIPPMLPYCAKMRGRRIAGTAAYRVQPLNTLFETDAVKARKAFRRR